MSSIAVTGSASGTGVISLLAPVTNSDRTLTLPDVTGTVLSTATAGVPVNGPAFSALQGSQAVNSVTFTKLACATEEFDTNSNYDSATNYRFTPTVAGYYQVNGQYYLNSTSGGCITVVYKNGSAAKYGSFSVANSYGAASNVSALIYLNGSTDYVELYSYQNTGSTVTGSGSYFQASMVRSAV